jgi:hypothetical protein
MAVSSPPSSSTSLSLTGHKLTASLEAATCEACRARGYFHPKDINMLNSGQMMNIIKYKLSSTRVGGWRVVASIVVLRVMAAVIAKESKDELS